MKKLWPVFKKPGIYVFIILMGLLTKIPGLESKFFWLDEVFTMSHTTGIDWEEFLSIVPTDQVMSTAEYNDYVVDIPEDYHAGEQLKNLALMPQLNPLHYMLLVPWTHIMGGSMLSYRVFSLFFFVLAIIALFLWVRMMTPHDSTPWLAAALLSVSPILNFYSLEARYYTLWLFLFIVCNALFWQVFIHRSKKIWAFYILAMVLLIYTSALSLLLLGGHFLFVLLYERPMLKKYIMAAALILLVYMPWIALITNHTDAIMESTNWQEGNSSFWMIVLGPFHGMASGFFAVEGYYGMGPGFMMWEDEHGKLNALMQALVVLIILASIIMMLRKGNRRTASFVLLPLAVMTLFFIGFDLSQGRIVSIVYRYHITNIVAGYILLAFMLERLFEQRKWIGPIIFAVVFVFGTLNYIEFKNEPCYNNPHFCEQQEVIIDAISNSEKPLIVVATQNQPWPLMFAWEMTLPIDRQDAYVVLEPSPELLEEHLKAHTYSDIFLYAYATWLDISQLKFTTIRKYQEGQLDAVPNPSMIWDYADAVLNGEAVRPRDFIVDVAQPLQMDTLRVLFHPMEKIACDSIFIVGNHYALGSFTPDAVALQKTGTQQWEGKFAIEHGADILFRFTQGDWSMQLGNDQAEEDNDNYYHIMRGDTTFVISHSEWRKY